MSRKVIERLKGGDRRSIGEAGPVAALASENKKTFGELVEALWDADPLIRMRAADAAEKASSQKKDLLQPFKHELLGLLAEATQQELRWHLAQMVPRLELTRQERARAASALCTYLDDRSSIVKTWALNALAELAMQDHSLQPEVLELVRHAAKSGTPAMRARAKHLLRRLDR